MSTITTPKQVNSVLKDLATSIEAEIVLKIRAIFERRGGFHKLQQRQIFVNIGSTNKTVLTRLQHISMLHADKARSTAGTIMYQVDTAKQNLRNVKSYQKKLNTLNVARNTQRVAKGVDFHYKTYAVQVTIENSSLADLNLNLPTFAEIKQSLKDYPFFDDVERGFALSYLAYLSKCLGRNPQFNLSEEIIAQIMSKDIFWFNRVLCIAWTMAVDVEFNSSDL